MPTHKEDLYPGHELYLSSCVDDEQTCQARQPDDDEDSIAFTCTRAIGHEGDHAAHGLKYIKNQGPPQFARWPQSSE